MQKIARPQQESPSDGSVTGDDRRRPNPVMFPVA